MEASQKLSSSQLSISPRENSPQKFLDYNQEKVEIEALRMKVKNMEKYIKKMEQVVPKEVTYTDIVETVDIGNEKLNQLENQIDTYRKVIESLRLKTEEPIDIWSIYQPMSQIIWLLFQNIVTSGDKQMISETKAYVGSIDSSLQSISRDTNAKQLIKGVQQKLEVMKELSNKQKYCLSQLQLIQNEIINKLPPKYHIDPIRDQWQMIQYETYIKDVLEKLIKDRKMQDYIMIQIESGKIYAQEKDFDNLVILLRKIIPEILDLTEIQLSYQRQTSLTISEGFDILNKIIRHPKFSNEQFRLLSQSIESFQKIFERTKIQWDLVGKLQNENEQLQRKVQELEMEILRLQKTEWPLQKRECKPPVISNQQLQKINIDLLNNRNLPEEDWITMEKLEGYYQFLNKIIRKEQKNIQFLGGDTSQDLNQIFPESANISKRLSSQLQAMLNMQRQHNSLQMRFLQESQKTYCLLTKSSNLPTDLLLLEQEKRNIASRLNTEFSLMKAKYDEILSKHEKDLIIIISERDRLLKQLQDDSQIRQKETELARLVKMMSEKDFDLLKLKEQFRSISEENDFLKQKVIQHLNIQLNEIKNTSLLIEREQQINEIILKRRLNDSQKTPIIQIEDGFLTCVECLDCIKNALNLLKIESQDTLDSLRGANIPTYSQLFVLEVKKKEVMKDFQARIRELNEEIQRLKLLIAEKENQIKELNTRILVFEEQRKQFDIQKRELEQKIKILQQQIDQLKTDNINLSVTNKQLELRFSQLQKQINELNSEIERLKIVIQQKENEIKEQIKIKIQLENEINQKIVQIKETQQKCDQIKIQFRQAQIQVQDLEIKNIQLQTDLQNKNCEFQSLIKQLENKIDTLNQEISRYQSNEIEKIKENADIKLKTEFLQKEINNLQRQLEILRKEKQNTEFLEKESKYVQLLAEKDANIKELAAKLQGQQSNQENSKQLQQFIIELECKNGNLMQEVQKLTPKANNYVQTLHQLEDLKKQLKNLDLTQDKSVLVSQNKEFIQALQQENSKLLTQTQDLDKYIMQQQIKFTQFEQEINQLRDQLNEKRMIQNKLERQVQEYKIELEASEVQNSNLKLDLQKWATTKSSNSLKMQDTLNQSLYQSANSVKSERTWYDLMDKIKLEKTQAIQSNVLIEKTRLLQESPMNQQTVFQIFEEFMDEKFRDDQKLIRTRSMPDFMLEFIYSKGQISQQLSILTQLLASLKLMCSSNQEYGILFARILQVYHQNPVDLILCEFLVLIRKQFQDKLTYYQSQSLAKQSLQQQERGGMLPFNDIFDLIQDNFANDNIAALHIMTKVKPDAIPKAEFVLYIIICKMNKLNLNPQQLFAQLDTNMSGFLSIEEFVEGLNRFLDLWFETEELEDLIGYVDDNSSGLISFNEFSSKIEEVISHKGNQQQAYLVSKCKFLTAICDEYEEKRERDYQILQSIFNRASLNRDRTMSFKEFELQCQQIQQNLPREKIKQMFENSQDQMNGELTGKINQDSFILTLYVNEIGGFGFGDFKSPRKRISSQEFSEKDSWY